MPIASILSLYGRGRGEVRDGRASDARPQLTPDRSNILRCSENTRQVYSAHVRPHPVAGRAGLEGASMPLLLVREASTASRSAVMSIRPRTVRLKRFASAASAVHAAYRAASGRSSRREPPPAPAPGCAAPSPAPRRTQLTAPKSPPLTDRRAHRRPPNHPVVNESRRRQLSKADQTFRRWY